jgi:hypothetical protein
VELRTGDQPIVLEAGDGAIRTRLGRSDAPDLTLTGPPTPILGLLLGLRDRDAVTASGVEHEGDVAILERFGAHEAVSLPLA